MAGRVLVVDDEPAVREAVGDALRYSGYEVTAVADGAAALAFVRREPVDAIVLDVLMPRVGGIDVCRRLRAGGDRTPILVLTARDAVADRVAGLDAGADDYLVKPFAPDELLARLGALLRRVPPGTARPLAYADLTLDPKTRVARRGDRRIELTRTEYALLELLLRNAGTVVRRAAIVDRIWGYESTNSLEVFVGVLRRKTEAGGEPRLVQTVRGIGYVLRVAP